MKRLFKLIICCIFLQLSAAAKPLAFNDYSLLSWITTPASTSDTLVFDPRQNSKKMALSWNTGAQVPGEWVTVDQYNAQGSSQIIAQEFKGSFSTADGVLKEAYDYGCNSQNEFISFPMEIIFYLHPNTSYETRYGKIKLEGDVKFSYNDREARLVHISYEWNYKQRSDNEPDTFTPGEISPFFRTYSTTCTIESLKVASDQENPNISYRWEQKQEDMPFWSSVAGKTTPSITVTASDVQSGNIFRRVATSEKISKYSNECQVVMIGDPTNDHYILHTTYNYQPGSNVKQEERSISYIDPWGRVKQQVEVAASANCKDIITHFEYDHEGRSAKTFLPYAERSTSQFRTNAASAQVAYCSALYPGETHPYSEKIYETSALGRVKSVHNYGKVFRTNDKKQTFTYDMALNSVRRLVFNPADGGFTVSGTHAKLFVNGSTNEDGQTVRSYTDGWGRTVASCTDNNGVNVWTMYVYDALGRLMWVVSPEGAARLKDGVYGENHDLLKKYCYMYKYSYHRNLMIAKRLPGAEAVYMLYNGENNLIGVQDGNQRPRNEWTLTQYDTIGRMSNQWSVVSTSIDHTRCPVAFNVLFNSSTSSTKLLACSYDTYPAAAGALAFSAVDGVVASADKDTRTTGMKTYEWVKIIGDNAQATAIERAFYYDKQGRVIQTVEKNHFGRISAYSSRYDFVGNVLASVEKHDIGHPVEFTLTTQNTFDHRSRLLASRSKVNNSTEAKTNYSYNDVGQMVKKQQDGEYNTTDYSYNIQGWMTKSSNQFFTEQLKYYDPEIATTKPLYSGNISEMRWRNRYPSSYENRFAYTYDKLNRLTGAEFYSDRGNLNYPIEWFTEKGITYDLNGNMTAMNRFVEGKKTTLSMTYDGNQLAQFNKAGYFEYDANGNTTATRNTGKDLQFEFNSLNLLDNVKQNGAVKASYIWAADGVKIGVKAGQGDSYGFAYLGSMVFTRTGSNMVELESVAFPEGRFEAGRPVFFVTDHLGSVRAEVDGASKAMLSANDYMPFGERFSADGYGERGRYLFSGKEKQTTYDLNLLDFGARMYDSKIPRWITQDPLAEKYYSTSPYAYCAGNPVRFVDPNGMEIDESSLKEWKLKQEEIKRQRELLQKSINKQLKKNPNSSRIANLQERISSIGSTLKTMNTLENSSQMYSLKSTTSSAGELKLNGSTIEINYNGTSNFVHEVTHAGQFERGEIGFVKENDKSGSFAQDVFDEVSAFRAQYNYEPGSVASIAQGVTGVASINAAWVQSIRVNGIPAYMPGRDGFNTGLTSVGVNSTVSDFRKAYPNASGLQGFPASHKLINHLPIYYKK